MTAWSEHQAAKAHRASEAKTEEAVAWLANLEAKGVTTKPGKWPR